MQDAGRSVVLWAGPHIARREGLFLHRQGVDSMNTFIRVAEIWVPDAEGHLLEFGGGVYDNAPDFGAASRAMCFGRGEGLPGRVWEAGRPILLKDLQGGYFQRSAAARAAGLACAVAFPVFAGERLKAVVVLFCGDGAGQSGAIELWRNDPRVTTDMTLLDGVYGAQDAAFEAASRQTYLPRGTGLPGLAWQRQASVFMDGLSESSKFVRAGEAAGTALRNGFAIPCPVPTNETYVLAFLSALETPIATRIESWVPGADGQSLQKAYGASATAGGAPRPASAGGGADATVLEAFQARAPKARQQPMGQARGAGASLLALPVMSDADVVEAVAMYF